VFFAERSQKAKQISLRLVLLLNWWHMMRACVCVLVTIFISLCKHFELIKLISSFLSLSLVRTRASMERIRRTWSFAVTARVCMCRLEFSSQPAKSTSPGSRSTISGAKWSSAVGRKSKKSARSYCLWKVLILDNSLLSWHASYDGFQVSESRAQCLLARLPGLWNSFLATKRRS
jgi:hypothetical protein